MPLIGIILCFTFCMIFRTRMAGSRFCCWGSTPDGPLDDVRKELRDLKEEIGKMKEKQR
jgi:hypothetical protein